MPRMQSSFPLSKIILQILAFFPSVGMTVGSCKLPSSVCVGVCVCVCVGCVCVCGLCVCECVWGVCGGVCVGCVCVGV